MRQFISKSLISSGAVLFLLSACNLDRIPQNAITSENAFKTEKELNTTTMTIHFNLFKAYNSFYAMCTAGDLSDRLTTGADVKNWSPVNISGDWKPYYDAIFEANLLLENINKTDNLSEDRVNFHRGQALFVKGLCYLDLVQRFGDVIITTTTDNHQPYPVSPSMDVIDESIKAGEEAYRVLPVYNDLRLYGGVRPTTKQFASKGAAAALLAHAYAWKGSMIDLYGYEGDAKAAYQKSVEYASLLIDGKVGNYSLYDTPQELSDALSNSEGENKESIFVIGFDKNRYAGATSPNTCAEYVSWPLDSTQTPSDISFSTTAVLFKSTIDEMYPDAGDLRRSAYFYNLDDPRNTVDGETFARMNKYHTAIFESDQTAESGKVFLTIDANLDLWRLGGIILLRAENYAKLGNEDAAIRDLNRIRERAGAAPYPAPQDTKGVQYAVFKERERELIYENSHRYFDIVRNGIDYVHNELQGIFKTLTLKDIKDGALVLPVPEDAKGKGNRNTFIIQKNYWSRFGK